MAYRPKPTFTRFVERFLKGHTYDKGDSSRKVCGYIHKAVEEKMEREPKGYVELMQKIWDGLSEKEKREFEKCEKQER